MVKRGKLSEEIKEYLRELIDKQKGAGDIRLPSEQQLSIKFSASRGCVRKSLDDLVEEGLIYKIMGKGSFVNGGNALAKLSRSDNVAFIFPEPQTSFPWEIYASIRAYFKKHQINVLNFPSSCSVTEEQENIMAAKSIGCKGIILMPVDMAYYNNTLLSLVVENFPLVVVDRKMPGLDIPFVSSDHFKIGYDACKYLYCTKKHKNIAYITIERNVSSIAQRIRGLEAAVNGENRVPKLFVYANDTLNAEQLAEYLKSNSVTGILVNNGNHAVQVMRAYGLLNKNRGTDYDLVVIDQDISFSELIMDPNMPCIVQDSEAIGKEAAKMLFEIIYLKRDVKSKCIPLKSSVYSGKAPRHIYEDDREPGTLL